MYGKMYKEPSSEWAKERLLWNTMQGALGMAESSPGPILQGFIQ